MPLHYKPELDYIAFEHITLTHLNVLRQYLRTDGATLAVRADASCCESVSHYKSELERAIVLCGAGRGMSKAQTCRLIEQFFVKWDAQLIQQPPTSDASAPIVITMDDPAF